MNLQEESRRLLEADFLFKENNVFKIKKFTLDHPNFSLPVFTSENVFFRLWFLFNGLHLFHWGLRKDNYHLAFLFYPQQGWKWEESELDIGGLEKNFSYDLKQLFKHYDKILNYKIYTVSQISPVEKSRSENHLKNNFRKTSIKYQKDKIAFEIKIDTRYIKYFKIREKFDIKCKRICHDVLRFTFNTPTQDT